MIFVLIPPEVFAYDHTYIALYYGEDAWGDETEDAYFRVYNPDNPLIRAIGNAYMTYGAYNTGDAYEYDPKVIQADINVDSVGAATANVQINVYDEISQLFDPKVTELISANEKKQALWRPVSSEVPRGVEATIMKKGGFSILYDGWFDLSEGSATKPYGATRYGEILGYDIYSIAGEMYTMKQGQKELGYNNGGLYRPDAEVSIQWSIVNTYRAVGQEFTRSWALSYPDPDWSINNSPILKEIGFEVNLVNSDGVYTEVGISRTYPPIYLERAIMDAIQLYPTSIEDDPIMVAEFLCLVAEMMQLYGEPVITDQEKALLLETYGRQLPYDLPERYLSAVEYLMCRGIIEPGMDYYKNITFEEAATILMRVKDKNSRLTFKEIQITYDAGLISAGYHPTEVSINTLPITVVSETIDYTAADYYDYFLFINDATTFHVNNSEAETVPFISEHPGRPEDGALMGTVYMGREKLGNSYFYHFQILRELNGSHSFYEVNTPLDDDLPYNVRLPVGGGIYYSNDKQLEIQAIQIPFDSGIVIHEEAAIPDSQVQIGPDGVAVEVSSQKRVIRGDDGKWHIIIDGPFDDVDPHLVDQQRFTNGYQGPRDINVIYSANSNSRMTASIATREYERFTVEISREREKYVMVTLEDETTKTLNLVTTYDEGNPEKLKGDLRLYRVSSEDNVEYSHFVVVGTSSQQALGTQVFKLTEEGKQALGGLSDLLGESSPMTFAPAYSYQDKTFMVSLEYLQSIGIVRRFAQIGEGKYYLSVKPYYYTYNSDMVDYSDVFVNTQTTTPTVVKGNQLTIFPKDTMLVYDTDSTMFLDWRVIAGVTEAAPFKQEDGSVILPTKENHGDFSITQTSAWRATLFAGERQGSDPVAVSLGFGDNVYVPKITNEDYLICSITYPLANYIAVNDLQRGTGEVSIYSFYPTADETQSTVALDALGITLESNHYYVKHEEPTPDGKMTYSQFKENKGIVNGKQQRVIYLTDYDSVIAYIPDAGGASSNSLYEWVKGDASAKEKLPPTSFMKSGAYCCDLNYNLYQVNSAYSGVPADEWLALVPVRQKVSTEDYRYQAGYGGEYSHYQHAVLIACARTGRLPDYTGCWSDGATAYLSAGDSLSNCDAYLTRPDVIIPAIAGAQALISDCKLEMLGYTDGSTSHHLHINTFQGILLASSEDYANSLTTVDNDAYSMYLIHLSGGQGVDRLWLQAFAPTYQIGEESPLSDGDSGKRQPSTITGNTPGVFDWLDFISQAKLEDADDILTILIIAVLTFLPRFFMFLFILLMVFALIADVKPWQAFCTNVWDPYKFLTAGRQNVHTIEVRRLFIWSLIALALFGLFQNGLILQILAWLGRAVTGILRR